MTEVEGVLAREIEFYAAQTASDVAQLDEIMSANLTSFVHTTGRVENKAEYLAGVEAGRHAHGSIDRVHAMVRVSGDGAVTIGVIDMQSRPPGVRPFTMRLHQVLVWTREDGTWRLLSRQATRQPL